MRQTMRTARHDPVLGLDAYCLRGLERPFPSHFHGHYVIGVVEREDRARHLLERGLSPAETALAAGFADQSHFTNYFTAYTGLTPGAYRALFREERESG